MDLGLAEGEVGNTWALGKGREEPPPLAAAWTQAAELHPKGRSVLGFQCCARDLCWLQAPRFGAAQLEQLAYISLAIEQSLGARVLLVSVNCLYKH